MTTASPDTISFADPEQLAVALAGTIAELLRQGIGARRLASLVVSGGTTPGPLFAELRREDLPWEKVFITLADERWVDPESRESNEWLVRSLLLRDKAAGADFVPLKNRAATALAGEEECRRALDRIPRPFDVVLLGMGRDGHTASLLPGASRLAKALAPDPGMACLAIASRQAPHERITLTLPTLLQARQIFLHCTGLDKELVLRQAMADGPVAEMPVRAILRQQQTPVHIYWSP